MMLRAKYVSKLALAVVIPAVFLAGCALPVPIQVGSWVIDGISYLATERSITDNGISLVAQEDCSVWRGFTKGELCTPGVEPVMTVMFRNMSNDKDALSPSLALSPLDPQRDIVDLRSVKAVSFSTTIELTKPLIN